MGVVAWGAITTAATVASDQMAAGRTGPSLTAVFSILVTEVAGLYRSFARLEARGRSAAYEALGEA
ncbi:MAG: hypothetical protein ACRDPO_28955, partial [Streptosporangiaceae bacterium]